MRSKPEVRQHVEKAFEFMIKTISSDGRGGRPAMKWHAERLVRTVGDMPEELRQEAILTAKLCASQPMDELIARDARHLYELFVEGLKARSL